MFRSLVCLINLRWEWSAVKLFSPPHHRSSSPECRLPDQRTKRLRRLGNRTETMHFAPSVEMDGTVAADDHPAMPNPASEPTWLNAAGGWNGSATTEHGPDDRESAAALFPTQASSTKTD